MLAGCSKLKPAASWAAVHEVNAPKLGLVAGVADTPAVAVGAAVAVGTAVGVGTGLDAAALGSAIGFAVGAQPTHASPRQAADTTASAQPLNHAETGSLFIATQVGYHGQFLTRHDGASAACPQGKETAAPRSGQPPW